MKRNVAIIAVLVIAVIVGIAAASWFKRNGKELVASGTLEARNIEVGSKVGGRITQVLAQEGDRVEPNQLLVTFDAKELEGQLLQARGRYEQAKANYEKFVRGSRPEEVAEAKAGKQDRRAEVSQSKAELERAQAEFTNAEANYHRYQQLANEGVVSRQLRDDAEMRRNAARAQVEAAQHAIAAANDRLQAATAVEQRTVRGFRREDIAAAKADVTRAEGELKEAEARWAERELRAPAAATIEVMDIRPGDLVAANSPIARLLEVDQLYVMVYVPQDKIGQVRVGQKAEVRVDAFRDRVFPATVEQVRQKAEFLPRNVQTAEEREHQVIGVKLRVENKENRLRAGVHADVRFVEEGAR
jgi:multidrug resistance efflux pump